MQTSWKKEKSKRFGGKRPIDESVGAVERKDRKKGLISNWFYRGGEAAQFFNIKFGVD